MLKAGVYRNSIMLTAKILLTGLLLNGCASTKEGNKGVYAISFNADKAYTQSNWTEAEVLYLQLTKLMPDDARAYFRLGNVYLKQGQVNKSVAAYEKAIFTDSEKAKYYHNLAVARMMQARQSFAVAIDKAKPVDQFQDEARRMLKGLDNITSPKTHKSVKNKKSKSR